MRYAFVMDFAGDNLTAGFVSESFEITGVSKLDLANFMAGDEPPVDKLISLLAAKMGAAPGEISVIPLALDCDLSPDRRSVVNIHKASWLNGLPLADMLENALGKPAVLERRAQVFLNYDRITLGLPEDALIIGCYINDGYENAIWARGGMICGKSGAAGNISHMPIHDREDNCYCGRMGCICLYGGGTRLKQIHSLIFSDIPIEELFVQHSGNPILQDFLKMMIYPLAVEANLLDPDYLILGGQIPTMPEFPFEDTEYLLQTQTYHPFPSRYIRITPSIIKGDESLVCIGYFGFAKVDAATS